jgi:hypothetical protein
MEVAMAQSRHNPGNCLEGLTKTTPKKYSVKIADVQAKF